MDGSREQSREQLALVQSSGPELGNSQPDTALNRIVYPYNNDLILSMQHQKHSLKYTLHFIVSNIIAAINRNTYCLLSTLLLSLFLSENGYAACITHDTTAHSQMTIY